MSIQELTCDEVHLVFGGEKGDRSGRGTARGGDVFQDISLGLGAGSIASGGLATVPTPASPALVSFSVLTGFMSIGAGFLSSFASGGSSGTSGGSFGQNKR
jgi:hypothetical protein